MLYLGVIALQNNGTIFSFAGLQVHELGVLSRFVGILDFPLLKLGIRDFPSLKLGIRDSTNAREVGCQK